MSVPAFATDLYDAVTAKNAERVMHLPKSGADPNKRSPYDGPLHMAARLGLSEIAAGLIAAGADVELPGFGGIRPLHAAAVAGQAKAVSLLLSNGAEVDSLDNSGSSPLLSFVSADAADLDTLKALLTSGADPNFLDGPAQLHALDFAAIHGRPEIADLLIAFGANMNAKDNHCGETPLHYAISFCQQASRIHLEIVQLLIDRGADVNATDSSGLTPLDYAKLYAPNSGLLHHVLVQAGAK